MAKAKKQTALPSGSADIETVEDGNFNIAFPTFMHKGTRYEKKSFIEAPESEDVEAVTTLRDLISLAPGVLVPVEGTAEPKTTEENE